jgi:hypothetical protein
MLQAVIPLLVALGTAGVALAVDVDVRTLDQRALSGPLAELSPERVVVTSGGQPVSIPAAEVLTITPRSITPPKKSPATDTAFWIELVDGSRIAATEISLDGANATIANGSQSVRVSTPVIRSVEMQAPTEPIAKRWAELRAAKATSDRLIVRRSETTIDSIEGTLRRVTADTVDFELDGEIAKVKRPKVFGFFLYRPGERELGEVVAYVEESSKARWAASRLQLEKDSLRIATSSGVEVVRPWSSIARLDYSAGKLLFLSDLEPETVTWTPLVASTAAAPELESYLRPRRDRAIQGGALQLAKTEDGRRRVHSYEKGVSLHSRTRIVYRLPNEFRNFTALAGIDARMKGAGGVRLEILADDKKLLEKPIRGTDDPLPINLDVRGAGRLTILVDFGDDGDVADHLNLCDARLAR